MIEVIMIGNWTSICVTSGHATRTLAPLSLQHFCGRRHHCQSNLNKNPENPRKIWKNPEKSRKNFKNLEESRKIQKNLEASSRIPHNPSGQHHTHTHTNQKKPFNMADRKSIATGKKWTLEMDL